MSRRTKKLFLLSCFLLGLVVFGCFAILGNPSLWAKEFTVDPATNEYLATTRGLSAEDAALEFIYWKVPVYDRTPRDRVSISLEEQTSAIYLVKITYSAQDDSYHRIFYELTLKRQGQGWSVIKMRSCWKGRGLKGWSTGIPS